MEWSGVAWLLWHGGVDWSGVEVEYNKEGSVSVAGGMFLLMLLSHAE